MKQDYKKIVSEVLGAIQGYRTETLDLAKVDRGITVFKCYKLELRELFHESNRLYMCAKIDYEEAKAKKYKEYRGMYSGLDSTNYAKLDCIEQGRATVDLKCQRDKCRGMMDDLTDIIIDLQVKRRSMLNEITYG